MASINLFEWHPLMPFHTEGVGGIRFSRQKRDNWLEYGPDDVVDTGGDVTSTHKTFFKKNIKL